VLAQSVRVVLDGDDHGVVQQSVEQGRGDHGIAEDLGPFAESAVAGHDHGAALVTGVDQLEEQVTATRAKLVQAAKDVGIALKQTHAGQRCPAQPQGWTLRPRAPVQADEERHQTPAHHRGQAAARD